MGKGHPAGKRRIFHDNHQEIATMRKKQLAVVLALVLLFIISGCVTFSYKNPHITETTLTWFAFGKGSDFEDKALKEEYRKKIDKYVLAHPHVNKEHSEKMKDCRVILGMSEEEVLVMAKPNRISKKGRNKKIFQYSDVGKFGWSSFIGEGVRTKVTFTNGIVTDISEVNITMGS